MVIFQQRHRIAQNRCFQLFFLILAGVHVSQSKEYLVGSVEPEFPQCPTPCGDNPRVLCPLSKAVPPREKDILFQLDGGLEAEDGW